MLKSGDQLFLLALADCMAVFGMYNNISIYMYISNVTFYFNYNIKDSSRFTVSNVTLYSRLFIYINWLFITFSVYF